MWALHGRRLLLHGLAAYRRQVSCTAAAPSADLKSCRFVVFLVVFGKSSSYRHSGLLVRCREGETGAIMWLGQREEGVAPRHFHVYKDTVTGAFTVVVVSSNG